MPVLETGVYSIYSGTPFQVLIMHSMMLMVILYQLTQEAESPLGREAIQ